MTMTRQTGYRYVDVQRFFEFLRTHGGVQAFRRNLLNLRSEGNEAPYRRFLDWEKQKSGEEPPRRYLPKVVQLLARLAGYPGPNWEDLLLLSPPPDPRSSSHTPHTSLPAVLRNRLDDASRPVEILTPPGFGLEDILRDLRREYANEAELIEVPADTLASQAALWNLILTELHDRIPDTKSDNRPDRGDDLMLFRRVQRIVEQQWSRRPVIFFHRLDRLCISWSNGGSGQSELTSLYSRLEKLTGNAFLFGTIGLRDIDHLASLHQSPVIFDTADFNLCERWDDWVNECFTQLSAKPDDKAAAKLCQLSQGHPEAFTQGLKALVEGGPGQMQKAVDRIHASIAESILIDLPNPMRDCLINERWNSADQAHVTEALLRAHILKHNPGSKGPGPKTSEPMVIAWKTVWARRRSSA